MGASRVRYAKDLYLFGLLRRTDWLPVGGQADSEQIVRTADSISDSEDRMSDSTDYSQASTTSFMSTFQNDHNTDDESFHDLLSKVEANDSVQPEWLHLFDHRLQ